MYYFFDYLCFFGILPKKTLPNSKSERIYYMCFSPRSFMQLAITHRSMIHSEVICVCGVRENKVRIWTLGEICLIQHRLLNRPLTPNWSILAFCWKSTDHIFRVSTWTLEHCNNVMSMSILMPDCTVFITETL